MRHRIVFCLFLLSPYRLSSKDADAENDSQSALKAIANLFLLSVTLIIDGFSANTKVSNPFITCTALDRLLRSTALTSKVWNMRYGAIFFSCSPCQYKSHSDLTLHLFNRNGYKSLNMRSSQKFDLPRKCKIFLLHFWYWMELRFPMPDFVPRDIIRWEFSNSSSEGKGRGT